MREVPWTVVLTILLGSILSASAQDPDPAVGDIVAIVGGDPVTTTELDRRIELKLVNGALSPNNVKFQLGLVREGVLRGVIDELLILQEATRRVGGEGKDGAPDDPAGDLRKKAGEQSWAKLARRYIGEREIEREIEERIKQLDLRTKAEFYAFTKKTTEMNRREIHAAIRRQLTIRKFLSMFVYGTTDPFVSPQQLGQYYKKHLDEFTTPVEVSFRRITLNPDRDLLDNVAKITQSFEEGVPFVEVARKYSQDYQNPDLRGKLQTRSFDVIHQFAPAIAHALRTLRTGEISIPPVQVSSGHVYYFFVDDRVEGKPKPFEEAQPDIEKKLLLARREMAYRELIEKLRDKTVIKNFLPHTPRLGRPRGDEDSAEDGDGSAPPVKDVSGK